MRKRAWIYMVVVILAGTAAFAASIAHSWDVLANMIQNQFPLLMSMLALSAISRSCPLYLRNDQAFDISVVSTVAIYLYSGTRIAIIVYVISTFVTFEKCADGTVKSLYNTELKNSLNVVRKQALTDLLFPICLMKKAMKSRNIPKNTVYIR